MNEGVLVLVKGAPVHIPTLLAAKCEPGPSQEGDENLIHSRLGAFRTRCSQVRHSCGIVTPSG